jgi:hypothetical protein
LPIALREPYLASVSRAARDGATAGVGRPGAVN